MTYESACAELLNNCKKVCKHQDLFLRLANNYSKSKNADVALVNKLNSQVLEVIKFELFKSF